MTESRRVAGELVTAQTRGGDRSRRRRRTQSLRRSRTQSLRRSRNQSRRRSGRRRDPIAFALGFFGELLITMGVLLGLFVVWQLWWTDIEARRHTDAVISEIGLAEAPMVEIAGEDMQFTPGPAVIPEGAYAVLHVPRFGLGYQVPIEEGVGLHNTLNNGLAGHYPDTAQVGQIGNFALAGHRQSHGAVFRYVDQLRPGDPLIVQTVENWYVYRVTESRIVEPSAIEVLAAVPGDFGVAPTEPAITLTTCHPLWSVAERFIVHGKLEYWAPISAGTPAELLEI
ncbi:MAG TPA: class E sortase [Actinomycetaceae bacterium]|nr:class E sortase [Actinomycetaceae bacterium]